MAGITDAQRPAPLDGLDAWAALPPVGDFGRLADPAAYTRLTEGWVLGVADVVRSTEAIAAGRYKAVNTVGASVIAALANALGGRPFPFVFGGDGASFAVPGSHAGLARDTLAATAAWARDELDLELRAALIPVAAVREQGLEVRVARFAASSNLAFAMFDGGGLAWAERALKRGAFAVPPASPGSRPDLTGLSCRFEEIAARRGVILSLIVTPEAGGDTSGFSRLVEEILLLADEGAASPVPENGLRAVWPPAGFELEVRAQRRGWPLPLARLRTGLYSLLAWLLFKTGLPLGGFDPTRYRHELAQNTDFRKFDDGLRMTLDCTPSLAGRIETLLARAEAAGVARCGTHRQTAALMTCFVPAPARSDHVHFIDGAAGGYAAAATALKRTAA
ncbi:DUF3095 domain-containing protein [Geminicoccaceae bacterium 1502E]|nr:DUF3095 domain-containing protein [Geminicoccaceae bacterium 1502E]